MDTEIYHTTSIPLSHWQAYPDEYKQAIIDELRTNLMAMVITRLKAGQEVGLRNLRLRDKIRYNESLRDEITIQASVELTGLTILKMEPFEYSAQPIGITDIFSSLGKRINALIPF
jgi:hypothetical protein